MSFSLDLRRFELRTEERAERAFRGIGLHILRGVVFRTPVDKGRMRGNWNVGLDAADLSVTEETDPGGSATIRRGQDVLSGLQLGQTLVISNNVPYAEVIEDGSSQQAPNGVVRVTLVDFPGIVEQEVRDD